MKRIFLIVLVFIAVFQITSAQKQDKIENLELVGSLSTEISSESGQVFNIAITIGDGGSGPYKAIMTSDRTLETHTIFRPMDLSPFDDTDKLPIVVFANGGCRNSSGEFRNFLSEIASQGFLVISIGPINNTLFGGSEQETGNTDSQQLLDGIDWAIRENMREKSHYYNKLDTEKIALMGQSCGGAQALDVSDDPRIATTVILNSGIGAMQIAGADSNSLNKLHAPIIYLTGGGSDMATANAEMDFQKIDQVPVVHASYDFTEQERKTGNTMYGHYPATYREPNGGDFAIAVSAWLNWQLKDECDVTEMFLEDSFGVSENPRWSINKKNID